MGVISTYPAVEMGTPYDKKRDVPVALSGRVPVKVTTSNGAIKVGDPVTSSHIPGVGMKATRGGRIIGFAINSYDREGVGLVTVFIKPQWYSGSPDGLKLSDTPDSSGNSGSVMAPNFYSTIPEPDKARDPVIISPVETLNRLHPTRYQLPSQAGHYIYGFLPESVERAVPGAVLRDENGISGIDYNQIIPLLVESSKEQGRDLQSLKKRISDLEKKQIK